MKGYYLVRGDKTSCGGQILAGSTIFTLNGHERIREGDPVSCGKDGNTYEVTGGIDNFTYHGRRVAGTLDSFSGCPCRSRLLNSIDSSTYESARASMRSPGVATARTSQVPFTSSSSTSPTSPTSPFATRQPPALPIAPVLVTATCPHPDRMHELAGYIADEMNRNIRHPSVLKMRELNSYDAVEETKKYFEQPFYLTMGHVPNFNAIELAKKAEAFALWTERVGQNRPWDHKPIIRKNFGGFWHKHGEYDYYYDIWSNIHYGYVGTIGGISESALLDGAGLEQIASDTLRKVKEVWNKPRNEWELPGPHATATPRTSLRSWDDVADRVSISIGIKLAGEYWEGGLTAGLIMDEVLAFEPTLWGDGAQVHKCEQT
jgi:uncharacterized Zn-binding protein involved in type VI secretion